MKTIQQLLELNKNRFYRFTTEEQAALDDFLSKKWEEDSKISQKKKSKESPKKTPATAKEPKKTVRVKNVVSKIDTEPPEVS